jgi:hypothetical protein
MQHFNWFARQQQEPDVLATTLSLLEKSEPDTLAPRPPKTSASPVVLAHGLILFHLPDS